MENATETEIKIERRYAILQVTPEFLVALCKDGNVKRIFVEKNMLPKDTRFVGVGSMQPAFTFNPLAAVIGIIVESESFADVPLGSMLPILEPPTFKLIEEAPLGIEAKCPSCGALALQDCVCCTPPKKRCLECSWESGKKKS